LIENQRAFKAVDSSIVDGDVWFTVAVFSAEIEDWILQQDTSQVHAIRGWRAWDLQESLYILLILRFGHANT